MSRGWWLAVALVACRPPALPPVPDPPGQRVDLVPARARQQLLVAKLALEAGALEVAVDAAGRAARFDPTAAPPLVVLARAQERAGHHDDALRAVTQAIDRAPDALEPRVLRLQIDRDGPHQSADVAAVLGHPTSDWGGSLYGLADLTGPGPELARAVSREARRRVFSAGPDALEQLLPVLAAHDGGLAYVVAALRLHRVREVSPDTWTRAAGVLEASGCIADGWSPLPPDRRSSPSSHDLGGEVGYQRGPDDDRGWHTACAGQRSDAVVLLTRALSSSPQHPTLHEQLWLVQQSPGRW